MMSVARKSVPLQAKKEWSGTDSDLLEQVNKMSVIPGGSMVVDYSRDAYTAFPGDAVRDAKGTRREANKRDPRGLGEMLAEEFIECEIGSREVYFDALRQKLMVPDGRGGVTGIPFAPTRRIRTNVKKRR